jgi:hypothetical protein
VPENIPDAVPGLQIPLLCVRPRGGNALPAVLWPKNGLLVGKFHFCLAFAASFLAFIAFLCAVTHPFQ